MNDSELAQKLKSARVPDHPAEYWENFPRTVLTKLNRSEQTKRRAVRLQPRFAWGFGLAFVCALLGLFVWHNRSAKEQTVALLKNEKVIRETLEMFPNQVRAIVRDKNGTELILSEKADVPTSTPLWIRICNGKECRDVITFSGQSLQIAKEKVEVLADAQGQVMLVGDRLFWSAKEKTPETADLRIQARAISYAL